MNNIRQANWRDVGQEVLDQLFLKARTNKFFEDSDVPDSVLREIYSLAKMAPTTENSSPMRILFAKSRHAKERVISALNAGNVDKTKSAPVTAIIAYDIAFYDQLPILAPHMSIPSKYHSMDKQSIETVALRNSSIQAAFLILAARAVGLDCGPMSGFDNAKIDETVFAGTTWRSNFLINLGYGSGQGLRPRAARLSFDDACKIS